LPISAKVLVEDYPLLTNPFFSYAIPDAFKKDIHFGTLVFVPFGLSNALRKAIVVDFEQVGSKNLKSIHSVLCTQSPLSQDVFAFLLYVSSSYFYPLSLLMKISGIIPQQKNIRYWIEFSADLLKELPNKHPDELNLLQFLESHPEGFYEDQIFRKLHWNKSNKLYRKWFSSEFCTIKTIVRYPLSEKSKKSDPQAKIRLLNGLDPSKRLEWLITYLSNRNLERVLVIAPSLIMAKKIKKRIKDASLDTHISIETKRGLLKTDQLFDLIFVENGSLGNYAFENPFRFSPEKIAFHRSMLTREPVIISSFLPSVFAYFQLKHRQLSHISPLKTKESKLQAPRIALLSMNREIQQHGFSVIPFTALRHIQTALDQNQKTFLLINRKGYYNYLLCRHCVMSVSSDQEYVHCRYCQNRQKAPYQCPECDKPSIRYFAPGTQKIEEFLEKRFYGKKILRLDKDNLDPNLQQAMEQGQYDIIVGTVMALDHLDFSQINLCLWMGLDALMNYPSFSAEEEALLMLSRLYENMFSNKTKKTIMIPSYSPNSELLNAVRLQQLASFYSGQLKGRKQLAYPPYANWMELSIISKDPTHLEEQLHVLRNLFKKNTLFQLKSIKKIPPGLSDGKKGYSLILSTPDIMESFPFLSSIIDEYKKNEKIWCKIKVLE